MADIKNIIEALRFEQELRKSGVIPSEEIRIGRRNPSDGTYEARRSNGDTQRGIRTSNGATTTNQIVRGIPSDNGIWGLDWRNIAANPISKKVKPKYRIAILYSYVTEVPSAGEKRVFFVGGASKPIELPKEFYCEPNKTFDGYCFLKNGVYYVDIYYHDPNGKREDNRLVQWDSKSKKAKKFDEKWLSYLNYLGHGQWSNPLAMTNNKFDIGEFEWVVNGYWKDRKIAKAKPGTLSMTIAPNLSGYGNLAYSGIFPLPETLKGFAASTLEYTHTLDINGGFGSASMSNLVHSLPNTNWLSEDFEVKHYNNYGELLSFLALRNSKGVIKKKWRLLDYSLFTNGNIKETKYNFYATADRTKPDNDPRNQFIDSCNFVVGVGGDNFLETRLNTGFEKTTAINFGFVPFDARKRWTITDKMIYDINDYEGIFGIKKYIKISRLQILDEPDFDVKEIKPLKEKNIIAIDKRLITKPNFVTSCIYYDPH